ncbi:MAG TPA: hypothetical protein VFX13_07285 [Gaiellales bacterium]|jgi:hypothetical protein|nr:hypothetical protein [Gaiellales bacterium]
MEPLIVALVAVAALVVLMFVLVHIGMRTWRSVAPDARERLRRRRDVRRGIREIEAFLAGPGVDPWEDEHQPGPAEGRPGGDTDQL